MTNVALEQAITFLSRTDLIAAARQQPLPAGVIDLLKISSGDGDVLLAAQEESRHSQEDVRHAAEFYVQQILFAPESDHYRILGVDPDDAEAKIKLHYRLLVRWLHPDKNASDWEAVFSERINRAWHALRTPERRRHYDEQLSSERTFVTGLAPSREIKPAQWRESKSDARFMSSRTIKRLPVAVFSVLGIGALLALWLFSQTQPNLQAPVISKNDINQPTEQIQAPANGSLELNEDLAVGGKQTELVEVADTAVPEEKKDGPEIAEIPESLPVTPSPKIVAPIPALAVKTTAPVLVEQQKKKTKAPEKSLPPPTVAVVAKTTAEEKPVGKRGRKNKTASTSSAQAVEATEIATLASSAATTSNKPEAQKEIASEAAVKQFLQRFSRVYSEGDYFALHNLFTKDLTILGAPPQRTVLRSYRQLFENSESREISLDHVTWLTNDENIVVIASYEAQVLPRGKAETKLTRGDIRLDLRVENGQLKIIRLQSDTKNG